MPDEQEAAADDATAAFVRLSDQVDSIDRKLSALIEVATALDARDGANAATLVSMADRLTKLGTQDQTTRAIAILLTKSVEPALNDISAKTRNVESSAASTNAHCRATLRKCTVICTSTVVVVAALAMATWISGLRSAQSQTPAMMPVVMPNAHTACRSSEPQLPPLTTRSENAYDDAFRDAFRKDWQGPRQR